MRVDPATGEPAARVTPIVRARGAEVGIRSLPARGWQTTLALWGLEMDSELLFVGDAGTTAAGRPSRRTGIEWTNYWRPAPWLTLDGDLSLSRARFTDADPIGDRIPGAVERVLTGGISLERAPGLEAVGAGVRARYFGSRPLVEDDSVRSDASLLWEAHAFWEPLAGWRLAAEVFNLLDAEVSDVDYFYVSRLSGEPAGGIADIHTHPVEPRSVRVTLRKSF